MANSKTLIAAAIAVIVGSTGAQADTVTKSISLDTLLSAPSGSFASAFFIDPILASNGLAGGQITSATLTAFGFSDENLASPTSVYSENVTRSFAYSKVLSPGFSYSYGCGIDGTCFGYVPPIFGDVLERTINIETTNISGDSVADQMVLHAGFSSVIDTVDMNSTINDTGFLYDGVRDNGTYGQDTIYRRTYTASNSFNGGLQASYEYGALDLISAIEAGGFGFAVRASVGSFHLTKIELTMNVSAVPEPETAALMFSGLALVAATARRRRRDMAA